MEEELEIGHGRGVLDDHTKNVAVTLLFIYLLPAVILVGGGRKIQNERQHAPP